MRYLGGPLIAKRLFKIDCLTVMTKITHKIGGWVVSILTYAGRRLLVQSMLQEMSCYWSAMFLLLQAVAKHIDKRRRQFLYCSAASSKVLPLVDWETVSLPKSNIWDWSNVDFGTKS